MTDDPSGARRFHGERLKVRGYDELIGLCKGLIADHTVNEAEAVFLLNWLENHPDVASIFPANIIADRLAEILADNILDPEEADELLVLLRDLTGEKGQQAKGDTPTSLAFNNPMPPLNFMGGSFCLTGTFLSGERRNIAKTLEELGGVVVPTVTKKRPCCLIVGSLVTESWIYSTHGRKLEAAVAYRDDGREISIVSEDHLWDEIGKLK